jgi:hypothetical protein
LATAGQAIKTKLGKDHAMNKFECFLDVTPKYKCKFEQLDVAVVSDQDLWLEFAYYLVHQDPKNLKGGTVVEYLRKAMGVARDKFRNHQIQKHRQFWQDLDAQHTWLHQAVRQVHIARSPHSHRSAGC